MGPSIGGAPPPLYVYRDIDMEFGSYSSLYIHPGPSGPYLYMASVEAGPYSSFHALSRRPGRSWGRATLLYRYRILSRWPIYIGIGALLEF